MTNLNIHQPHRRIIVGDGVAAAALTETCTARAGDTLIVVGYKASQLGRGLAYASEPDENPWRYAYLLNSPADDIAPDFGQWVVDNWEHIYNSMVGRSPDWIGSAQSYLDCDDKRGLNVPRAFFGEYMEQRCQRAIGVLRERGVNVEIIDDEAVSLDQEGNGFCLRTASGQCIYADAVDIATGGPKTQRIEGDDGPFCAPELFGHEERIAEHAKRGADIWCVGTNATMLDALRLCQSVVAEDKLRFTACSPRGVMPDALIARLPRELTKPELAGPYPNANAFLEDVEANMQLAQTAGHQMREIRAGFRAFFIEHGLKHFVPDLHEARLVPPTLRHWLRGGTRDTLHDFHRLSLTNHTRVVSGAVSAIESTDDGVNILLKDETGALVPYKAGFVINCSGAGSAFEFDPLTRSLIDRDWISICNRSGGIRVGEGCETSMPGVRYLSPATTIIGDEVMPMPLYDAHLLCTWATRANQYLAKA